MYETIERIEENSELIIESLPNPYTAYTGSTYEIYIPFSATSVCSVEFSCDDEYDDCIEGYHLENLTNPENMDNLYALHLSIGKYLYLPNQEPERTITFAMSANTCNVKFKNTTFSVTQTGCPIVEVTFDWGLYDEQTGGKNYTVTYHAGDNINDADIRYGLEDLITEGLGCDGKFYYDQAHQHEVIFDCDTVFSSITIYASVFRAINFNVVDARTEEFLDSVSILINGEPVGVYTCFECELYKYVIKAPYDDEEEEFTVTASRDGYNSKETGYTLNSLNEHSIRLEKLQTTGEFTITFEWNSDVDFDPYIQIFDGNMHLLNQDRVSGILTRPANLYYGINRGSGELDREWAEESGYNEWWSRQGRDKKAYAAIKCDGIFYEHDYDYTGGDEREPVEHMSGKVKLNDDRVYRVMLNDCSEDGRLSSLESKVTLVLENVEYPPFEASEDKVYWTVFDIKKINGIWTAVTIDEYSDIAQPGFIGCPGPSSTQILSQVEAWDNAGEIVEGRTGELTFSNYYSGYEMEFNPNVTGSYHVNITITEGVGYPCLGIYSGSNQCVYSVGPNESDISIDSNFTIRNIQPHTFKFALWTGGEGGGTIEYTITKV